MAAASQDLVQRLGTRADACADAIVAAAATRLGSGAARGSSLSTDADAVLSAAVDCLSEAKVAAPPVPTFGVAPTGRVGTPRMFTPQYQGMHRQPWRCSTMKIELHGIALWQPEP